MFKKLFLKKYIGKTVIVDICIYSKENEISNRYQYFGEIVSIDNVITIKTDEGKIHTLPPDVRALNKAVKGIYTLNSNGKQIENPDYTASWSVFEPNE